jgi:ribosomal protein L37AE/L43A
MSDKWDERKKNLEEEYFRRKEQEALEKMRAKRAAEEAEAGRPKCPRCGTVLIEITYEDVQIDRCGSCGGVWLDQGELEHLTATDEGGLLTRFWRSLGGGKSAE